MKSRWLAYGVGVLLLGGVGFLALRGPDEPEAAGAPASFRRLTDSQYARSIHSIFDDKINIPGRFEPPLRTAGLVAIGNSEAVVTPFGLEQHELRAREIAMQVMADDRRNNFLSCGQDNPKSFDEGCAREFLGKYGQLLFRRPLSDQEMVALLSMARAATEKAESLHTGLEAGLSWLLVSPYFTYRVETAEPDPEHPGKQRLNAYSLATRISFLLWNAPPDQELLEAAASGALYTKKSLEHQVDRMMASPQFEQGVRAFFSDMYTFEYFDGLQKDQTIYPRYTSFVANDAREQTLRTIVDFLVTNKGDYRDLFTTKKTFINRSMAALYNVEIDDTAFKDWAPYTFKPEDKRQGLLMLAGFLMMDASHEGKSSPTIRGKTIREQFLCQTVPLPPGDVDFSKFTDAKNPLPTVRERLIAHSENPTCAGCHKITDPIGLGFENFDAIGQYRTEENGHAIDASADIDGTPFKDVFELQQVLRDNPALPRCVAQRVLEYAIGHPATAAGHEWFEYLADRFAKDGYVLQSLMRTVATSNVFRAVAGDTAQVAAN